LAWPRPGRCRDEAERKHQRAEGDRDRPLSSQVLAHRAASTLP